MSLSTEGHDDINNLFIKKGRVFAKVRVANIKKIPISTINFSNPQDVARHDHMASIVDQMPILISSSMRPDPPHEQIGLLRQIEATDRQIEALVYKLYELTEEEIKIVEGT
jgi:hypothetical protein